MIHLSLGTWFQKLILFTFQKLCLISSLNCFSFSSQPWIFLRSYLIRSTLLSWTCFPGISRSYSVQVSTFYALAFKHQSQLFKNKLVKLVGYSHLQLIKTQTANKLLLASRTPSIQRRMKELKIFQKYPFLILKQHWSCSTNCYL